MKIDFLSRFDRAFKRINPKDQREIRSAIESFLENLPKGHRPQGLGLRRLKGTVWEFRAGLKYRILFELKKDWVIFLFVGNHDEVKRFLKNP